MSQMEQLHIVILVGPDEARKVNLMDLQWHEPSWTVSRGLEGSTLISGGCGVGDRGRRSNL